MQKDWNKACREKEKSDRDKGMNADGERRQSRQENKDYNDENTLFKVYSLFFIINYFLKNDQCMYALSCANTKGTLSCIMKMRMFTTETEASNNREHQDSCCDNEDVLI